VNPRVVHLALVIGGIALAAFVVGMWLLGGCAAELPPEPAFETTHARDASR
jgi:Na+/pantothenate symporter